MNKKVEAGTIVRTALLGLALTNQILSATGHPVLPIENAELETLITTSMTVGASLKSVNDMEERKHMNKKVEAGTIVRTALLGLALTNQILSATGHPVLPIENAELETLITTSMTVGASLWGWWKNNQILSATGHPVLPIENAELETLITTSMTVGASLWGWWKNNSFTPEAIEGDKRMHDMKRQIH